MIDLLLDENGDLDMSADDLSFVEDAEEIAQGVEIGLRSFKGEYILDRRKGLDAFGRVLGKSDEDVRDAEIKREIIERPGVLELVSYAAELELPSRQLTVTFTARALDGTAFTVTSRPAFIPVITPPEVVEPLDPTLAQRSGRPVLDPDADVASTFPYPLELVARASIITPIAARLVATDAEV